MGGTPEEGEARRGEGLPGRPQDAALSARRPRCAAAGTLASWRPWAPWWREGPEGDRNLDHELEARLSSSIVLCLFCLVLVLVFLRNGLKRNILRFSASCPLGTVLGAVHFSSPGDPPPLSGETLSASCRFPELLLASLDTHWGALRPVDFNGRVFSP